MIDGDTNFSDTALLEGWEGDGSPENPYIIDGLDIDLDSADTDGNCITILNTRASFTISNCILSGAEGHWEWGGAGIYLYNVTNGDLVNNICTNNSIGIFLWSSTSNILVNNTCFNNTYYDCGIELYYSDTNTVTNNFCSNTGTGISLCESNNNTVTNNTCYSIDIIGISIRTSHSNTLVNNTCYSNTYSNPSVGIYLHMSSNNSVVNNNCINIRDGIYLFFSEYTAVTNNTCHNNSVGILTCGTMYTTVTNNTCISNDIGMIIGGDFNTVTNNIYNNNTVALEIRHSSLESINIAQNIISGNTEHDIYVEFPSPDEEFDPEVLVSIGFLGLMGFAGITMLGAGWNMVKLSRVESKGG
jgi:parallel beta-helix repeat protein